ncbi:hypothetical protein L207DRAFT_428588 [Hyaloscypha variabilis F]|uniref:DUF3074 domain-containing protein n=1 Tax=Hyaloscypha variabilis (strain UAMH 11265 / GT02V1 / F) TaxID=1149755 RepID=A0A2J6RNG0_HYAVF|nr:hypothetical protein L207DRAFT_428588 [Hyaloscypha variabilis F]
MTDSKVVLGPWVRLEGISINQLPSGGKGVQPSNAASATEKFSDGSGATAAPTLKAFITSVLSESIPFVDAVQSEWKVKGSPKKFPSSEAPVHLYEKTVLGKDLDKVEGMSQFSADRKDETWFCRRSCHRNSAEKGTANWAEFVHSFKEHHAESEEAFTPTVIGAREAMRWDTSGIDVHVHGGHWTNITVAVEEMKHKIDPKPLKNRTFPVVQVAAMLEGSEEFLVVSISLNDFNKSPYAEYARDKALVMAAYTSIERIRVLPSNGDVEWIMATASDAGGVLPQWMQNLAVPGAIAKDVELFLSWIPSQRGQSQPAPSSKSKGLDPTSVSSNGAPPPISKTEPAPGIARRESSNKDLPAVPTQ